MALLLENGDYVPDGNGGLRTVTGTGELLQQVLFRLQVRRGSFPFLPELGSRLYLLTREKPSARPALARQYAAEALSDMQDIAVTGAELTHRENGGLKIRVGMEWRGERLWTSVLIGERENFEDHR